MDKPHVRFDFFEIYRPRCVSRYDAGVVFIKTPIFFYFAYMVVPLHAEFVHGFADAFRQVQVGCCIKCHIVLRKKHRAVIFLIGRGIFLRGLPKTQMSGRKQKKAYLLFSVFAAWISCRYSMFLSIGASWSISSSVILPSFAARNSSSNITDARSSSGLPPLNISPRFFAISPSRS